MTLTYIYVTKFAKTWHGMSRQCTIMAMGGFRPLGRILSKSELLHGWVDK